MFFIGGDLQLFTNNNPETTIKGLKFKNKELALESIEKIELIFTTLQHQQRINTSSPTWLRPRYFLHSQEIIEKFYLQQKMYRVLGLLNRAKSVYNRTLKKNILQSIEVFLTWMTQYHRSIQKYKNHYYIRIQYPKR